jgi:hypothetical protein
MSGAFSQLDRQDIVVQFDMDPVYGPVCIQTIGREAGASTVKERINDTHIKANPTAFARFQASRASTAPVGISLRRGLGMDEDLIRLFNTHGVMDVETFATLTDSKIYQVMPGNPILGIELRDRALIMVPEEKRTPLAGSAVMSRSGPSSREAAMDEIAALRAALAKAEQDKADALALAEALTAPALDAMNEPEDLTGESEAEAEAEGSHVRRGPGRPRRQQVA